MFLVAFNGPCNSASTVPATPEQRHRAAVDEATVHERHATHLRPNDATAYLKLGQTAAP